MSQSQTDPIMNRLTALVEPGALFRHPISVNQQHTFRFTLRASRFISPRKIAFTSRNHLHPLANLLKLCQHMSVSLCAKKVAVCLAASFIAAIAFGQANYALQGSEYPIAGPLAG